MHKNSLNAFNEVREEMNKRETLIYGLLSQSLGVMTDREIMRALDFPEPNCVRPRITELIANYWVREMGSVTDPISGVKVRKVRAVSKHERKEILDQIKRSNGQGELFEEAA